MFTEVETGTGVMPWLIEEVAQEMKTMITSRHVISGQSKRTAAQVRKHVNSERGSIC
jgi:hypothetical protein